MSPRDGKRDGKRDAKRDGTPESVDGGVVLRSEFGAVLVRVDRRGNGPRLLVEDLEDGAQVHLDPLELSSFCHTGDDERVGWLLVGPYRPEHR